MDNTIFRDEILQAEGVAPLVEIMDKALSEGDFLIIRDGNLALASICRTRPFPPFEEIKEAIPIFAKVIMSQEDCEILHAAVSCVSCFSDGNPERIQQIIDTGVFPYIIKCME